MTDTVDVAVKETVQVEQPPAVDIDSDTVTEAT
jgi:hypothetical protein